MEGAHRARRCVLFLRASDHAHQGGLTSNTWYAMALRMLLIAVLAGLAGCAGVIALYGTTATTGDAAKPSLTKYHHARTKDDAQYGTPQPR